MRLSCGLSLMLARAAGFQYPAVPSDTEADWAPAIAIPRAPAPMFRNSFEYLVNCAEADRHSKKDPTIIKKGKVFVICLVYVFTVPGQSKPRILFIITKQSLFF